MDLDQRGQLELTGFRNQGFQLLVAERRDDQQHRVGSSGARFDQLKLGDDEVFAQERHVHRVAHCAEVIDRPVEERGLGQNRQRRRTRPRVRRRDGDRVVLRAQDAARGRPPLAFGDHAVASGLEAGAERLAARAALARLPRQRSPDRRLTQLSRSARACDDGREKVARHFPHTLRRPVRTARGPPAVDAVASRVDSLLQGLRAAGDEERGARVEQHDLATRALLSVEHGFDRRRIAVGGAAGEIARLRQREPYVRRMDVKRVDAPIPQLGDLGMTERRDLIQSAGAVHDPRAFRAKQPQRPRDELGVLGPRHADELAAGAGRIGQRPEEIEGSPHAELPPRRPGVPHRRMPRRREEEREAGAGQRLDDAIGRRLERNAERFEHVGRSALARDRAVSVLGDPDARAGDDERRGGRDVEGLGAVAAGAAGVEHLADRRRHRHGPRPHRAREPDHLAGPFALERQRHQQTSDMRRLGLAVHDQPHRLSGFVARQVVEPP